MIDIKVQPYCHFCPEFEADSVVSNAAFPEYMTTNIYCRHRRICDTVHRFLEEQIKKEKQDDKD